VIETELLTSPDACRALAPEWEALAVADAQPMCLPSWMLAWNEHNADPGTELRVVAVRERGELIGVGPFCVRSGARGRIDYRLIGGPLPRSGPLAVAGREWDVAGAIAAALDRAQPRPDVIALECLPVASHWPQALRERWPGSLRPVARQYFVQGSPVASLAADSFEDWLAGKRSKFRSEIRRLRRVAADGGATSRLGTSDSVDADVDAFLSLHAMRWEGRYSSLVALGDRMAATLKQAGRVEVGQGRMRLHMIDLDGKPIGVTLCVAAGGEVLHFNGGWDPRHGSLAPGIVSVVDAIEHAFERGDQRMDFAPGDLSHKVRFADGNDPVAWTLLFVPGRRLALTMARSAPMLARRAAQDSAKRALSADQADRLRAERERVRRALRRR
jgi:CelD/BcsL family acetyltransferase involved in cellulose biosynthesis